MRVVLDTNVLVSAMLGGVAQMVLDHWQAGAFEVVVTTEIVQEYLNVRIVTVREFLDILE